jgi:cell division septum initiation protein DivIVA
LILKEVARLKKGARKAFYINGLSLAPTVILSISYRQFWQGKQDYPLADARDHLLSLSKALSREQATNQAQERRIADLETEVAQYRQQIGTLIAGVIAEKRPAPRRRAPSSTISATREGTSPRSKKPVQPKPSAQRKAAAASRRSRRRPIVSKRKTHRRKPR